MPIIVNIVGLPKIGTSVLCDRIKRSFESQNLIVSVVKPRSTKDVITFEDAVVTGLYNRTQIVLIDNHFYTTSAIKTHLRRVQFDDDSVCPNFSVLMTAKSVEDYQIITRDERTDYRAKQSIANLMDSYRHCDTRHYGSDRLIVLPVDAIDDRLYAAGYIIKLIKKEMPCVTHADA